MLKKIINYTLVLAFLAGFGYTFYFLYSKSQKKPVLYDTKKPEKSTILKVTVASGTIVPKQEVLIKPQVSGIVEALYVEPGQNIKEGQLIAKIKLVPNMLNINQAESNIENARIQLEQAERELNRSRKLYDDKVITEQEYNRTLLDFNIKKEALNVAESNLSLMKEGTAKSRNHVSNLVYSTIQGRVLDVPVKVGSSVIERNNFNEGTTITSVANMDNLIFEGKIDESEAGKLTEGLPIDLSIGALPDLKFKAQLYYISPKGVTEEGAIKFTIKAKILEGDLQKIRAGYSASASIVLERRDSVQAIEEKLLQFAKDSTFVEIDSAGIFVKRLVKTGLSDGLKVEILSGINSNDKIKVPMAPK
ncbi:MAG: efflux RND transporter periplasmic adaptor subunit [Cytophagales bacterium]|nr:efflux RND transporter periplasmic adaptor subunit [Cytophagales bacterium]